MKFPHTLRSFEQVKESVLVTLFGNRLPNGTFSRVGGLLPEVRDTSENNIYVRLISIWAGLIETINYQLDLLSAENFLSTCRRFRSAVAIAEFYDYPIKCAVAASVELEFSLETPLNVDFFIAAGTQAKTENEITFTTLSDATIFAGQTSVSVFAKNLVFQDFTQLAISTNKANQKVPLPPSIANGTVQIRVGGLTFASVQTFAYSRSTDRHFIVTVNEVGNPIVKFGDGVNGIIPNGIIEYSAWLTDGANGNVGSGAITQSSIAQLSVTNQNASVGGANIETLRDLKKKIPFHNRTKGAATTKQDFIEIAELHPSVLKAGVEAACGTKINVFIVPKGGGVANEILCNDVKLHLSPSVLIGREFQVLPTGLVRFSYEIQIRIRPSYNAQTVIQSVKNNLINFHAAENQAVGGIVELSDVYECIETTDGVQASRIKKMTTVPFARPKTAWKELNWIVQTNENSSETVKWKIQFISTTQFQLFRNGEYATNGTVGSEINYREVKFTILAGAYIVGDIWDFVSYPFFGTVELAEYSLPTAEPQDIKITTYV